MSGGTWTITEQSIRPGLYINFVDAAIAQITGGARGVVGLPVFTYSGNAEAGKFYSLENEQEALDALGKENASVAIRILQGGAKEVLAYAVPAFEEADEAEAYISLRDEFEARHFNVFVYPAEVSATEQDNTVAWVKRNKKEGKHFMFVTGGTAAEDKDPEVGNARSIRLKDDYVVNLITGVVLSDGSELSSVQYASYIAGLIAGTQINKSITYAELPVVDVNKRLKNSEIKAALIAGSLVIVNDGRKIKIEQGVQTNSSESKRGKIRATRARQAIASDISATACDHYIGKLDNNADGQAALISAIKLYLETLEKENVLEGPQVKLDDRYESKGDSVYISVSYVETDSMERIFLTINI